MTIETLYPEICNLFGEPTNVKYLQMSVPGAEVVNTALNDEPAFVSRKTDLVYMGSMTENAQELVIGRLRPYMDRLRGLVSDGTAFLMTGNAFEIFGSYIECDDGRRIEGLGLYDIYSVRRMMKRYSSLFLGRAGECEVAGFRNQFTFSYGDNTKNGLFAVTKGIGLNPGSRTEGVRLNNFMATQVLGPLLVLNPSFTQMLLRLLGSDAEPAFLSRAQEAYQRRVADFSDPGCRF